MADTKITQLQPPQVGYPVVPATDVLPIVVIADPGMATSGSTRKVTVNQLLGAGGTATLASATITGALTVDTTTLVANAAGYTDKVGIGTATPATLCEMRTAGATDALRVYMNGAGTANIIAAKSFLSPFGEVDRFTVAGNGVCTWSSVGDVYGPAMTLNSTGLGVGGSPNERFNVFGTCNTFGDSRFNVAFFDTASATTGTGAGLAFSGYTNGTTAGSTFGQIKGIKENSTAGNTAGALVFSTVANGANPVERLRIDSAGNCGIGVTPSAWTPSDRALQFAYGNSIATATSTNFSIVRNAQELAGGWTYSANGFVQLHNLESDGGYKWYTAVSGIAGNPVSFGSAKMTLDASGRLLVGSTSAFTDLTGSKEVKIGDGGMQTLTVASLPAATATNIARGGVGGLVYVAGFITAVGQYGAVVLWTASSATVVSVINGTGSTITFGVSGGFLQITSSLVLTQVTAACIRI